MLPQNIQTRTLEEPREYGCHADQCEHQDADIDSDADVDPWRVYDFEALSNCSKQLLDTLQLYWSC